jgi:hypothetical protein
MQKAVLRIHITLMRIRILLFNFTRIRILPLTHFFLDLDPLVLQNDPLRLPSFHLDPDPAFHFDADPDPVFHFDADPDPAFHFDVDPKPASQNDADPQNCRIGNQIWIIIAAGSGSGSSLKSKFKRF